MVEVFQIVPGPAKALILCGGLALLMAVGTVGFGYLTWSTRNVRVEVSPDTVRIRGDLFGRAIPRATLRSAEASAIDLNAQRDYAPRRRTFGTGLPGYLAGWFRLQNGEKALVFVTDRERVVRVPTTAGYSLLVSVSDPPAFLNALAANR